MIPIYPSIAAVMVILAGRVAIAQCPTLSSTSSGDSTFTAAGFTPDVATVVGSTSHRNAIFVTPFGLNASPTVNCQNSENNWKTRANGGSCSSGNNTYSDTDCGTRRLLNAAVLLHHVPNASFGNYAGYVGFASEVMKFNNSCTNTSNGNIAETGQDEACLFQDRIRVFANALFDTNVVERAAILAHEARHTEGDGFLHSSSTWPCRIAGAACDSSIAVNGAYQRQFQFLEDALQVPGLLTSPFFRAKALVEANAILNERFHFHPGFNLDDVNDGITSTVRDAWDSLTGSAIQIAKFADPDLPLEVFSKLGIAAVETPLRTTSRIDFCLSKLEFFPFENTRASRTEVCNSVLFFGKGSTSGPLSSAPQRTVFAPGTTLQSWPIRGLSAADFFLNKTSGALANLRGRRQGVFAGVASGSGETQVDPSTPGTWDLSLVAAPGFFITGMGLGVSASGTRLMSSGALNTAIGPEYEQRAGGNGGSLFRLRCDPGYIPIGTRQKATSSTAGTVVGYFGVVCALASDPGNAGLRRIARMSFRDPTTQDFFSAGIYPITVSQPASTTEVICSNNSMLRGLTVKSAGTFVNRIVDIRCTNGTTVSVNVGGTAGTTVIGDCWFGPGPSIGSTLAYAHSFYARSGDLLDTIAVGCYGPFDFTETFGPSPATLGSWTNGASITQAGGGTFETRSGAGPNRATLLTGPSASFDGNYLLLNGGSLASAFISRRTLDLSAALGQTRLQFRYHMFRTGSTPFIIVSVIPASGGSVGTAGSIVGSQPDGWRFADFDLSSYHGQVVDIEIQAGRGSPATDVAIDNVRVVTLP